MNDPIREWRDMDPADRGDVEVALLLAHGQLTRVADSDHPPDVTASARRRADGIVAGIAVLCEVAGNIRLPPTAGNAGRELVLAINAMEKPWQLVANIALLDRAVFPESLCEALSSLVLALRPAPAEPETKP